MKRTILIFFLALSLVSGFCQSISLDDVFAVETQISKAILDNDTAKYASLVANDLEFSVPGGNNISKRQFLLDMKNFWHPTEINKSQQRGRINKNVAVVTGLAEFKWLESDRENVALERYTETYIFENGKWLLLAGQSCDEVIKDKSIYESEVKNTVTNLWKAWEVGNRVLAEPIYANDFIDTDFKGTRRAKEEVLKLINPVPVEERAQITLSDWHFIVKNSTVVVNYLGEDTRVKNRKTITIKFRATDTFIKRYGHWFIISGQQSLISR